MSYVMAKYLPDPDQIDQVKQAIDRAFKGRSMAKGFDIIGELEGVVPGVLRRTVVAVLTEESILQVVKPSHDTEGCLYSLNRAAVDPYFQTQSLAATIIMETSDQAHSHQSLVGIVATLPDSWGRLDGIDPTDEAIRRLIIGARNDLWIVSPYFDDFGKRAIEDSLAGAASHHVKIKVIGRELSHKDLEDNRGSIMALRNLMRRFASLSLCDYLEVREFTCRNANTGEAQSGLHSKIVISDKDRCYIGSANMTRGSLSRNFELGVELEGTTVGPVRSLVERIWQESVIFELPK